MSQAIMDILEGEEIAEALITPHIEGSGGAVYKFLAKKKKDGSFEWVHFVQLPNGSKEDFWTGEVMDRQELDRVVDAINRSLKTAFGSKIILRPAETDVFVPGKESASSLPH